MTNWFYHKYVSIYTSQKLINYLAERQKSHSHLAEEKTFDKNIPCVHDKGPRE